MFFAELLPLSIKEFNPFSIFSNQRIITVEIQQDFGEEIHKIHMCALNEKE